MISLGLGSREGSLCNVLGSLEGARQTELGVDALDTVSRVDVLDHGDLVASGGTLARDDGGVGKEVFPDLLKVSQQLSVTEIEENVLL